MKKALVILTLNLICPLAFAGPFVSEGPGPVETFAQCTGLVDEDIPVSFEVRATAIPNLVDAVLVNTETNILIDHFTCYPGEAVSETTPSAGKAEWICKEYNDRFSVGYSVEIMSGGVTGLTTGQIKIEQMFPLQPIVIGSLSCPAQKN